MPDTLPLNDEQKQEQFFAWKESLACGDQDVDADHRHLLDIARQLGEANQQIVAGEIVIEELITFTREHFAREEALMRRLNYQGFDEHRFEHGLFLARVGLFQRRFLDGSPDAMKELRHFLRRWLHQHIMTVDFPMAQFLKSSSVDAA